MKTKKLKIYDEDKKTVIYKSKTVYFPSKKKRPYILLLGNRGYLGYIKKKNRYYYTGKYERHQRGRDPFVF